MDYLDNKYVIITLILLLLLFINNNTNETKEMIGGSLYLEASIVDEIKKSVSSITIYNKDKPIKTIDTPTIYSIGEINILFSNKYDIVTFFDITISNKEPFIYMYRYNSTGYLIQIYQMHSKEKRYKKIHYFSKLNLEAGDILKFVVPTSSIIYSQQPIIFIVSGEQDTSKLLNDKKLKDYKEKIVSLLTGNIDVFQEFNDDGSLAKSKFNIKLN